MLKKLTAFIIFCLFAAYSKTPAQMPTSEKELQKISETENLKIEKVLKVEDSRQKFDPIQDKGIFVDGAYTKKEAVVQHTLKFEHTFNGDRQIDFEEEISIGSVKHQLNFFVPTNILSSTEHGKVRGFGDLEIKYRYGLFGGESSKITVSPTFSVTLPTGSNRKQLGNGGVGTEISLPVSIVLSKRFVTHSNVNFTFIPRARNAENERAAVANFEAGQSLVWLAKPKFNTLLEFVWEHNHEIIGSNLTKAENELFFSPGFRWGYEFKNGLTVVPSIAIPIGIGANKRDSSIFFSLSFEHPLKKSHK